MCGILGVVGSMPAADRLGRALGCIAYRGEIWGMARSGACMMAVRRLPRSGNPFRPQPIRGPDGHLLALNGEVYNLQELLAQRGLHAPPDASDAECLLLYFMARGLSALHELQGEFSLAYYRPQDHVLALARDHFGSRPLYFREAAGSLFFGSSARAVSVLDTGQVSLDATAASEFLWYGVSPAGSSVANVRRVAPGTAVVFRNGRAASLSLGIPDGDAALQDLREALRAAVRRRAGGVRAALAYSGGIDSGLVRRFWPHSGCPSYRVAAATTPPLNDEIVVAFPTDASEALARVAAVAERPLTTLSCVALYLLAARVAADGYTVVLSGDGADEVFYGYPHYTARGLGHPLLALKHALRAQVCVLLGIVDGHDPSAALSGPLHSPHPGDWHAFDRSVRLPEHLCVLNNDIVALLARVENRLPYLDLLRFADAPWLSPSCGKRPLYDLAADECIPTPTKQGIFFPVGLLGTPTLLALADGVVHARSALPFDLPRDFPDRCAAVLRILNSQPPSPESGPSLTEAITGTVMGLWATSQMHRLPPEVDMGEEDRCCTQLWVSESAGVPCVVAGMQDVPVPPSGLA